MLSSILAFLIQLVILDPLTSQIDARLKQAQVPPALASSVNSCIKEALPDLVRRIASQPSQGLSLAAEIWLQGNGFEGAVVRAAPDCAPLLQAVKPFFRGEKPTT
ncbi:hypothetical protein [Bosea sp. (in: a-proteobacteria)]|uniref:hypothetical protein n=1 Tax=Bosea sp. (in: a-proteobacteria) TaxID=1871050 RepID=UPI00121D643B|nr:hypothetical protein [Bosea sp. (in: a-proteobacteria)]TAJ34906.1 MAG: hypothetical protein EPO59_00105 [Bosea sp. (in: a-proteobacteria)]